jgi:hypothetical protein
MEIPLHSLVARKLWELKWLALNLGCSLQSESPAFPKFELPG